MTERKDKMRLGMTLTSNSKDNSFVVSYKKNILSLKLINVSQDSPEDMGEDSTMLFGHSFLSLKHLPIDIALLLEGFGTITGMCSF